MGRRLSVSVRGNQAVPHATTCPYSSSVRKIFLDICPSDGSFFRSVASQNNDQGHEQAIYYLSRTMIGAEHRYNPIEKEMFGVGIHRPKNPTLLGGPNYTSHVKSQSFKIAYDKAIITK